MILSDHVLAVLLSLGTAFAIACHHLLVRMATDRGTPRDAVYVVITVNVVVLIPLVAVVYYPDYALTPVSWVSFVAAGLLGTVLGRVSLYTSITRIGASRTAPIVASNALVGTVFGVLLLGESVVAVHALGILMVVGGVATIAWETSQENPDGLRRRELLAGLVLPFLAAFFFGIEPIFAKFGLRAGTPAPVGLAIKTGAASVGYTAYLRWHDRLPGRELLRGDSVRWYVAAGLANTLYLLGFYLALALAPVNVVFPLIISNTLFVVVLSALVMPERLERVSWPVVVAAGVVICGIGIITLFG